jgi:hypothetical protein
MAVSGILNGFLFMGTAVVAVKGWDWRQIGNGAILVSVAQIVMIPFAVYQGFPADAGLGLFIWAVLAGAWGLVIHEKTSLKVLQVNLVLSVVAAWWFMVFYGNVHVPLSIITNLDNSIPADLWALVFVVLGAVSLIDIALRFKIWPWKRTAS